MGYTVEKDFVTKAGLRAVVIICLRDDGTKRSRCGYVAVPESFSSFGKVYDGVAIDCRRGLTYSSHPDGQDSYPVTSESKLHWFGFDCAHYGDANIEPDYIDIKYPIGGTVRTLEYCEDQCESIAAQLVELEVNALPQEPELTPVAYKHKITIQLNGCDDSTYIPLEVTAEELAFLQAIAAKSKEISTYNCMPRMNIDIEVDTEDGDSK